MDAPLGFEPRLTGSKPVVLPLDDGAMVAREGIEPSTRKSSTCRSTSELSSLGKSAGNRTPAHGFGDHRSTTELHSHGILDRVRTCDTRVNSPLLYQLSY